MLLLLLMETGLQDHMPFELGTMAAAYRPPLQENGQRKTTGAAKHPEMVYSHFTDEEIKDQRC